MEVKTYIKNIRISPKKLRFFLKTIEKFKPVEVLDYLLYLPKRAAKIWYKAIKSAIDNAKSRFNVKDESIDFKILTVEQGSAIKRYRPGGRGTVKPYKRRTAHIKIVLDVKEEQKKEKNVAKKEKEVSSETKTKKNGKISVSRFNKKEIKLKKK